ncbi:MAG: PspC domain-containing protein [Oscillospiraceae bacterium]|nr:PspC domain-containing protein [Oscillospiraceae bacterium]
MMKKLTKSSSNKMICGVCAGIANYFNIDPTIVRLIWALLVLCAGTGILAYIIGAIVIPSENDISVM